MREERYIYKTDLEQLLDFAIRQSLVAERFIGTIANRLAEFDEIRTGLNGLKMRMNHLRTDWSCLIESCDHFVTHIRTSIEQ